METAVQMNTRIGRDVKQAGDAVFARFGFSPSQVVRAVWEYASIHQDVPPFMKEREAGTQQAERDRKIALVRNGAGLACSIAQEQCGYTGPVGDLLAGQTWREMRDGVYDDMLDELEQRCG